MIHLIFLFLFLFLFLPLVEALFMNRFWQMSYRWICLDLESCPFPHEFSVTFSKHFLHREKVFLNAYGGFSCQQIFQNFMSLDVGLLANKVLFYTFFWYFLQFLSKSVESCLVTPPSLVDIVYYFYQPSTQACLAGLMVKRLVVWLRISRFSGSNPGVVKNFFYSPFP